MVKAKCALKQLDWQYSKIIGLEQTVLRAPKSFPLATIPHDFRIVYTLMNLKARRIDLTLLSSELSFHKCKDSRLRVSFPTDCIP